MSRLVAHPMIYRLLMKEKIKFNVFFLMWPFGEKLIFLLIVTQSIVIGKILIINAIHLIETLEYWVQKSRLIFINLIENLRGIQKTVILSNNQEKKI